MNPPLPTNKAIQQSIFYVADTPEGIATVNRVVGKTLATLCKSTVGCLLKFNDVDDYLILVGSKLPQFETPVKTLDHEVVEVQVSGFLDVMAVSLSGAGLSLDPQVWSIWEDPEAQSLVGMMLTGYSPSKSRVEDGTEYPSCMLEFDIGKFLVVTPVSVYVMQSQTPVRPS